MLLLERDRNATATDSSRCVLLQETARALWALATLKHKPLKVMRALCGQAEEILPQLNTLDLSNSLWALGTLHFNPGTLSQDIAQRALVLVDQFEPKVCCSDLA